ncbi:hypothetical protein [Lactobacillus helveticus]|uniref:hypothetical protein n=1 Tax=Lactobacillus helveticus TaxID=1587 RepID=UPI000BAC1772|nr:hypothetical protein [Lactobacillus helveticus]NHL95728.1 hypothetical protein [Lactobacillus helveticus]PAW07336.1 hypothetical protein CKG09_01385 [Lactobacillus helveticus]
MTKYTPLVKDMQKDLKKQGYHFSLEQTYQHLLKANFIDADGQPTKWAIKNGYVGIEYSYPQGMPTQDESDILTVLGYLPQSAIHYNDRPNLSGIDKEPLKKAIKQALHDDVLSSDGRRKWKKVLLDLEA